MPKFVLFRSESDQEILAHTLLASRFLLMLLWASVMLLLQKACKAYVWSGFRRSTITDSRIVMVRGQLSEFSVLFSAKAWYPLGFCVLLILMQYTDYLSGLLITADMRTTDGCGVGTYVEPAMPAVGAGVRLNQFWQHAGEVNKAYSSGIISDRWYVPNVFSASPRWKPTIDDTPGLLLKCVPEVRYAFMQVNVSLPDVRPQEFLGGGMKTSALRTLPADLQSLPKDQYGMQMSYAMGIRPDDGFSISLLHFHSLATWTSRSSNAVMVTMMAGTLLFDEWVNFAVKDQGGYIREGNVLFRGHTCEIVEAGFEYPWPLRLIQYFDRFITNDVNECSDKYARALPKMLDYSHLNDNQPFQALSETCIGATTLSSTLLTMITNFQEPKPVRITRQHTCVEIRALTFVAFSAPILALIFLLGLVVVGRLPILDQDIDSIPITQLDWAVHSMQEASGKPISKKEIAVLEKPCMMQADKKRYTVWFWTDPNSKSAEKSEDTVEVIEVKS